MNNNASDFTALTVQVMLALIFESVYACGTQGAPVIIHRHQLTQFYDVDIILLQYHTWKN